MLSDERCDACAANGKNSFSVVFYKAITVHIAKRIVQSCEVKAVKQSSMIYKCILWVPTLISSL